MKYDTNNPLIIQSDGTILLEVDNQKFSEARQLLSGFAQLEKSPEHIHSYSLTPLSLWNAKAIGLSAENIVLSLEEYTKYPIPPNVISEIKEISGRFGKINLIKLCDGQLSLESEDDNLLSQLVKNPSVENFINIDDNKKIIIEQKYR